MNGHRVGHSVLFFVISSFICQECVSGVRHAVRQSVPFEHWLIPKVATQAFLQGHLLGNFVHGQCGEFYVPRRR